MKSVGEVQGVPDRGRGHERGFKTARRRRSILSFASVVAVMAVCVLVLEVVRPLRIVGDVKTALPEGELMSAEDVRAAATKLQSALNASPGNDGLLGATTWLQERVAGQVGIDIGGGELDRADEILTVASDFWPESESWPESELFDDIGELRSALDSALQERRISGQVSELIDAAQEALSGGSSGVVSIEGFGAALRQLSQALDLRPGNERAQALRDDIRRNLLEAIRSELDAGNPDRAQEFLDVAQNEWPGDDDFARLRAELSQVRDALARAAEVQRLIDLGERQLAAGNLITPPVESAVDYFRRAQNLDPENEGASAGLARVADRHVVLIRAAVVLNDTVEARRLLARLIEVSPQQPEIGTLESAIEEAEEAEESPAPPVIAGDNEDRDWLELEDSCAGVERYLAVYPDGRYKEKAEEFWGDCLETR